MIILKPFQTIRLLLLICCIVAIGFAQQQNSVYDWKLKPGMLEWEELTTHDQMLKALKIPSETLEKMTTKDLALTCLNYPLLPDMWAFNSRQDGIELVIAGFNGLQELLKRNDSGKELYAIYRSMDPNKFSASWSTLQKGKFAAEFAKIEMLMAQEAILSSLKQYDRKTLLKESLKKQFNMQKYKMYDLNSQEPNAFLMGKILQKDYPEQITQFSKQKLDLQYFLKHGSMVQKSTIDELVKFAQEIVNN